MKRSCPLGSSHMKSTSVIVSRSRGLEIPLNLKGSVEHSSESLEELHKRLSNKGFSQLYIDSGITEVF